MLNNFLSQNTKILSCIDSTYCKIQATINENKNKRDICTWKHHFQLVWSEIQIGLRWPIPDEKSKKRLFLEKIFPALKKTKSLKLSVLSKIFPSLKYLANPREPLFTQSPILQKNSNVFLTFPPQTLTYKTIYGFDLCASGFDIQYPLMTGHYHAELAETLLMLRAVPHIDSFIDVGANIGFYSLLLAQEGNSKVSVFACEPSSENLKKLNTAIKINGMEKIITVLPFALGEKEGNVKLYLSSLCHGNNSVSPAPEVDIYDHEMVEIKTLDSVIKHLNLKQKNCLIKIDVEGYEEMVLMGGKEFLNSDYKPIILLEAWPTSKLHPKNNQVFVMNFLKDFGYRIFSIFPVQHQVEPLMPFDTSRPTKNLSPTGNYLAIPQNKMHLLKILNEPVDMRVFSSTDALNSLKNFLEGSCCQLTNRMQTDRKV